MESKPLTYERTYLVSSQLVLLASKMVPMASFCLNPKILFFDCVSKGATRAAKIVCLQN